jgi:hypothetical protein
MMRMLPSIVDNNGKVLNGVDVDVAVARRQMQPLHFLCSGRGVGPTRSPLLISIS